MLCIGCYAARALPVGSAEQACMWKPRPPPHRGANGLRSMRDGPCVHEPTGSTGIWERIPGHLYSDPWPRLDILWDFDFWAVFPSLVPLVACLGLPHQLISRQSPHAGEGRLSPPSWGTSGLILLPTRTPPKYPSMTLLANEGSDTDPCCPSVR